ncbi:DUF4265 domain-containing protein [Streptomyces cyaneofuscatus]|uniref:DUF4265 domain-containing protein n=1 Tax=Streptomyces cyaneofuscatus TaxID=66883 RepID=UPI0036923628
MSSPDAGSPRPSRDERPPRDERPSPDAGRRIKVWFRCVPREDRLPYETEGLWATRLSADTARVDNVPFLQDGVAEGETVRFTTDADGVHWSTGRVADSGNCTVRVLPLPDGPLGRDARAVHGRLAPFGLGGEVFSADFPLVAFTVPGGADLRAIKELLVRGEEEGWWHFEVSCATEAWRAA